MLRRRSHWCALWLCLCLSACAGLRESATDSAPLAPTPQGQEIVLYAISLIDTGYRFGGKNPEAGLDCSGMVSYIYLKAAGLRLDGSATDMAKRGRFVEKIRLRPGDLVFFNTTHRPHSHVGIYIGDGRFIHAPSSGGRVRADPLNTGWFAARFEEARTYFD